MRPGGDEVARVVGEIALASFLGSWPRGTNAVTDPKQTNKQSHYEMRV